LEKAIFSAALYGHETLVKTLLSLYPTYDLKRGLKTACDGAGRGGHLNIFNVVNTFLSTSDIRKDSITVLLDALKYSDLMERTPEQVLRVASFIDDSELRTAYIIKAHDINRSLNKEVLVKQASTLNNLIRTKSLNYNQAVAWSNPKVRTWLLQTDRTRVLPQEIVERIASYISPLTDAEVHDLAQKMQTDHQEEFQRYLEAHSETSSHKFTKSS
jgi:hypothetical protein